MTSIAFSMSPQQKPSLDAPDEIKAAIIRETTKAKANTSNFSRLRNLSSSFSKNRASHDRKVNFDMSNNQVHSLPPLDEETREILFLTYKDKVSTADDVEETCYRFHDHDSKHPYMQHLDSVWGQCESATSTAAGLELSDEALLSLVNTRGRGMEKKLITDMKRSRDAIVKQVLDSQKTFKNLPVGSDQRAKLLKNKYKKLTTQSKVFAMTIAKGDTLLSSEELKVSIAATSA